MKDSVLIVIVLLLTASIGVWLMGWLVYPFGFLVLSVALIVRLTQIWANSK